MLLQQVLKLHATPSGRSYILNISGGLVPPAESSLLLGFCDLKELSLFCHICVTNFY